MGFVCGYGIVSNMCICTIIAPTGEGGGHDARQYVGGSCRRAPLTHHPLQWHGVTVPYRGT